MNGYCNGKILNYTFRLELVSDVVGTSIHCGSSNCRTGHLNLKSPVQIEFEHSDELMVSPVS